MKRLFDIAVLLENGIAVAVGYDLVWLHSRWHWMTGRDELRRIEQVMSTVLICSPSALLLRLFSLWAFRLMKKECCEDLGMRRAWARASALVSGILLFLSLLPISMG